MRRITIALIAIVCLLSTGVIIEHDEVVRINNRYNALLISYKKLQSYKERYNKLYSRLALIDESYSELYSKYESLLLLFNGLKSSADLRINPKNDIYKLLKASNKTSLLDDIIREIGVSKDMSSKEKARRVLEWIVKNTYYEYDDYHYYIVDNEYFLRQNFFSLPNETLERKGGDCEDLAILAYALLKRVSTSEKVYLIKFISPASGLVHDSVLYESGNGYMIIDPSGPYVTENSKILLLLRASNRTIYLNPMGIHPSIKLYLIRNGIASLSYGRIEKELNTNPYSFIKLSRALDLWLEDWGELDAYILISSDNFTELFNSKENFLSWWSSHNH